MRSEPSSALLDRVRKLLAKAEAEGVTPPEAEALTAKAAELMAQLVALGLIEPVEPKTVLAESGFELTSRGEAFANASAARPVFRKTAEILLQQFLERKRRSFRQHAL